MGLFLSLMPLKNHRLAMKNYIEAGCKRSGGTRRIMYDMVSCLRRNVMNHAPTAHALPFSNTENNILINVNESSCASVGA